MKVLPADVLAFLGQDVSVPSPQLLTALDVVSHMVHSYVRGAGFTNGEPDDALAAVIISATARLTTNPTLNTQKSITVDDGTVAISLGTFKGWTLPELAILHTYRRRAI